MDVCPRCHGALEDPARSRVTIDRDIKVCSGCGLDEAVRDAAGLAPIPPQDWPTTSRSTIPDTW